MRTKTQSNWHLLQIIITHDYANVEKVCNGYIKFYTEQTEKAKSAERQTEKRLIKESVENADFYKPALNKIITTQK